MIFTGIVETPRGIDKKFLSVLDKITKLGFVAVSVVKGLKYIKEKGV